MVRYSIDEITDEMVLGESVFLPSGKMLLNAGYTLTNRYKERLKELGYRSLLISVPGTEDVVPDTIVSDAKIAEINSSLADSKKELESVIKKFRNDKTRQNVHKQIFERRKDLGKFIMSSLVGKQLESMVDEIFAEPEIVLNLAAMEKSDDNFFRHSLNVAITSLCIGRKHQFTYEEMKQLGIGALNYHIGLLALPDSILYKDGKLTEEEKMEYRQHTIYGHLMLSQNPHIPPTSSIVALQHHERQDGNGYPLKLKGTNSPPVKDISQNHVIHRFSEIVTVCDTYHNILVSSTEDEDVENRNAVQTAIRKIIKFSGSVLNKEIVKTLISIIPVYPIGTRVRIVEVAPALSKLKRYIGVVAKDNSENLTKPGILLYQDIKGENLDTPIFIETTKVPGIKFEPLV